MIEVVVRERCISCDLCVQVCPTRVFDLDADNVPVIARQDSCQTCFQCEAYCPTDALFVAPSVTPLAEGSELLDLGHLEETRLIGSYRRQLGWGNGRAIGARTAIPPLDYPDH